MLIYAKLLNIFQSSNSVDSPSSGPSQQEQIWCLHSDLIALGTV